MAQSDLAQVLGGLPRHDDPNVLVGTETADDAGAYRLDDELALVQSVDFFTPVVDDPAAFGAVAAANALSDIYAMGAVPFAALNIVGFPVNDLELPVLREILRGAAEVCREAKVAVIGGHSIDDKEPKFGLAVTGRVHPDRIWTNAAARAGDRLVLTKPVGIGILTTAIKRDRLSEEEVREVVKLMTTLNRDAAAAAREVGIHAATDVTGYGLLGHLHEMAHASGLAAQITRDAVPVLSPRVAQLAAEGVVPGGSRRNLKFVEAWTDFDPRLSGEDRLILADAQTSGGLLLAVSSERTEDLVAALRRAGTPAAAVIGDLVDGEAGRIRVG